jgi:hypothetical protein
MTLRQILALEFVMVFQAVWAAYGRPNYTDYRVLAARQRYREAYAR